MKAKDAIDQVSLEHGLAWNDTSRMSRLIQYVDAIGKGYDLYAFLTAGAEVEKEILDEEAVPEKEAEHPLDEEDAEALHHASTKAD